MPITSRTWFNFKKKKGYGKMNKNSRYDLFYPESLLNSRVKFLLIA